MCSRGNRCPLISAGAQPAQWRRLRLLHQLDLRQAAQLAQQECVPISPDWPTGRWEANEVARSAHTFRVDPFLPAG